MTAAECRTGRCNGKNYRILKRDEMKNLCLVDEPLVSVNKTGAHPDIKERNSHGKCDVWMCVKIKP